MRPTFDSTKKNVGNKNVINVPYYVFIFIDDNLYSKKLINLIKIYI